MTPAWWQCYASNSNIVKNYSVAVWKNKPNNLSLILQQYWWQLRSRPLWLQYKNIYSTRLTIFKRPRPCVHESAFGMFLQYFILVKIFAGILTTIMIKFSRNLGDQTTKIKRNTPQYSYFYPAQRFLKLMYSYDWWENYGGRLQYF